MQLSDWPLVLGGPVVRRVEPRLASVWLALKAPATVRLEIWQGTQPASVGAAPLVQGNTHTLRGDRPVGQPERQ